MTPATVQTPSRHASEFYKRVIQIFQEASIDFLVGGAFAFVRYTGIGRDTKDLDLFIRRADWDSGTARSPKKASRPSSRFRTGSARRSAGASASFSST